MTTPPHPVDHLPNTIQNRDHNRERVREFLASFHVNSCSTYISHRIQDR